MNCEVIPACLVGIGTIPTLWECLIFSGGSCCCFGLFPHWHVLISTLTRYVRGPSANLWGSFVQLSPLWYWSLWTLVFMVSLDAQQSVSLELRVTGLCLDSPLETLPGRYAEAVTGPVSFVSCLLGITLPYLMSCILKTIVLYILSVIYLVFQVGDEKTLILGANFKSL